MKKLLIIFSLFFATNCSSITNTNFKDRQVSPRDSVEHIDPCPECIPTASDSILVD